MAGSAVGLHLSLPLHFLGTEFCLLWFNSYQNLVAYVTDKLPLATEPHNVKISVTARLWSEIELRSWTARWPWSKRVKMLGLQNAEIHLGLYLSWGGSDAGTVASDCGFAYWLLPVVSPSALNCEMNYLSILVCLPVQARWNSPSIPCIVSSEVCMHCSYL